MAKHYFRTSDPAAAQVDPGNTSADGSMAQYLRLLSYVKPYSGVFAIAAVGMIIDAATQAGFAWLIEPMLDGTFVEQDPMVITWLPIALVVLFVVRGAASFSGQYGMGWVGRKVVADLRRDLFHKYVRLPVSYFDRHSSGQIISRLTYNTEQVALASTTAVTVIIRDTLTIIAMLGLMIYHSGTLTMTMLAVGPVVGVVVLYVSRRFRTIGRRIQDSMGDVTQVTEELVDGHRVVKTFGGEDYEKGRFEQVNESNRRLNMKMTATDAASAPFVQFAAACGLAAIVYMATRPAMLSEITPGAFMSFIAAMLLILPALKRLTTVNSTLQKGVAAAESIFSLIDGEEEPAGGDQTLEQPRGEIVFDHISMRYADDPPILHDVSFTSKPGTVTALVGRSGAGKSSLVSLLPRFYPFQEGELRIDGVDIREINLANLRSHIALVSQDIVLFNDSVERNIAYGALGDCSKDQVRRAAEDAHALEFIEDLPEGFDTLVGENGVRLSGGQRQRIAIARALLKNAPILILDEATSALDTEAERIIQQALDRLMRQRTTMVIAHRLSTIENADQVVVLEAGRVVEKGTHAELLDTNGHYATLHALQFGSEQINADGPAPA